MGTRIVWTDDRNGNADIYMYNLSTSRGTQITNNPAAQTCPAIYENKVVWEDYRNGDESSDFVKNSDIHIGIITGEGPEFKTPVANFSSNASEENTSLSVQYTNQSKNETGTDTNTSSIKVQNDVQKTPCGFNFLIFVMIVLYLCKRLT